MPSRTVSWTSSTSTVAWVQMPVIVEKQQGLVYGADVGPFEIGGSLIVTCKVFGGDKNFVKLG